MLIFYTMEMVNALKKVWHKINNSAVKAGRKPEEIKLVAVSKTVELQRIIEGVQAGVSILGENRVQEARDKINQITEYRSQNIDFPNIEWHLVGNLQKNKAKTAVRLFDLIHSVDSIVLAEELNKYAKKIDKIQNILVQIKLSDEATKHGILENNLMELLEEVTSMSNLKLEGFMIMSPFFEDPEKTRPYFRKLREIAEKSIEKGFPVNELSMGMSNDFEVAIEEGATMVRIGTAIFGERPVK